MSESSTLQDSPRPSDAEINLRAHQSMLDLQNQESERGHAYALAALSTVGRRYTLDARKHALQWIISGLLILAVLGLALAALVKEQGPLALEILKQVVIVVAAFGSGWGLRGKVKES